MHSTHPGIYFNFRHNRLPSLRTVVQLIGTPCLSSSLSPSEASKWRAGWIKKYVRTIQNNPSTASKMITQLWPNPIGMHYEQQNRTREHHLQKIMPSNYPPVTLIDASSGVLCWNNMHATLTTLYFSSHPRHPAKGGYIIISCIGRYQQIVLGWRRCRHS